MTAALREGQTPAAEPGFIEALRALLTDADTDPAFRALACVPPGETVLAGEMDEADPTAIHEARELLRRRIAEGARDELLAVYRDNRSNAPYSPDAVSAGREDDTRRSDPRLNHPSPEMHLAAAEVLAPHINRLMKG